MESRKMRPTRKSSDYNRYVQELQLSLYNKKYNDTSNRIYEEVDFSEKDLFLHFLAKSKVTVLVCSFNISVQQLARFC